MSSHRVVVDAQLTLGHQRYLSQEPCVLVKGILLNLKGLRSNLLERKPVWSRTALIGGSCVESARGHCLIELYAL